MKEFGKKVKGFIEDHKTVIACGAIVVGAFAFYSKSFNMGYDCRVDMEKAYDAETGSTIVETLKDFDW